jgi:hypothetical protein
MTGASAQASVAAKLLIADADNVAAARTLVKNCRRHAAPQHRRRARA